jgi:hypothetical protein
MDFVNLHLSRVFIVHLFQIQIVQYFSVSFNATVSGITFVAEGTAKSCQLRVASTVLRYMCTLSWLQMIYKCLCCYYEYVILIIPIVASYIITSLIFSKYTNRTLISICVDTNVLLFHKQIVFPTRNLRQVFLHHSWTPSQFHRVPNNTFIISLMRAACPAHLILQFWIALTTFGGVQIMKFLTK